MKISQIQIQNLYTFTRKHYVEYYDLQTELVDHLANDIEAMWQEQPQLSFEEAKTKAFKKWMLEDIIFRQAGGTVLVFLAQIHVFFTISDSPITNSYKIGGLALAFTVLVLISYISLELLPSKAEKLLKDTYPEFYL